VPSSQALLGFLITAPPSVCVPDVIGVLAVWIQKQNKKKLHLATLCVIYMYALPNSGCFASICPAPANFHLPSPHNHCSKGATNYFVVIMVGGQDHPHPIKDLLNCFSVLTPLKLLLSAGIGG